MTAFKESLIPCQAGNVDSILASSGSSLEEDMTLLQDSFLENPTDRGAWQAAGHGVARSQIQLNH